MAGWSGWAKNDDGSSSNTKVDNEGNTHHLCDKGGSKENHSHVVVKETSGGGKVAHCNTHKDKR